MEIKKKQKVIPVRTKHRANLKHLYDPDTSETGDSMFPDNHTLYEFRNTHLGTISSEDFITLDTETLIEVSSRISGLDISRILKMGATLHSDMNIIYHPTINRPIKQFELEEILAYSKNKLALFLNMLQKENILVIKRLYVNGNYRDCFILNPYLIRKRKTFDIDCLTLFISTTNANN